MESRSCSERYRLVQTWTGGGGSHSDRTKSRRSIKEPEASGIASDLRLLHVKKYQTREYEVGYKKYGLILK